MKEKIHIKPFEEKGRHKLYLTLDCETATLPFANEIALNSIQKKNIAISKPLIYDIGWQVHDSDGNIYSKHSFLVTEIFCVPQVFNTAYYKEKRPIYLKRLENKETELKTWSEISKILFNDLKQVDFCCAFNAMFDFKKAIPFTENYIYHLYNADYQEWERKQKQSCQRIAKGEKSKSQNFDGNNFNFKGIDFPMIDIWGVACTKLINTAKYKKQCLANAMISESGIFFKTSAEGVFRYLMQDYEFDESHTAIEDTEIESIILCKALKKGKVKTGIEYFPFKILGETPDFLLKSKGIKQEYFETVIKIMEEKLKSYEKESSFSSRLQDTQSKLKIEMEVRFN